MEGKQLPMFIVDAFSSRPFCGNPAAICLLESEQEISDEVKQKLANEMNLSETAFVAKLDPSDSFQTSQKFLLRWFTPTNEVDLCGHATLATSAVLFHCCGNQNDRLTFESLKSGQLHASKDGHKVTLDFPNIAMQERITDDLQELVKVASCGQPVQDVQLSFSKKVLIRFEDTVSRSDLESLVPDTAAMHRVAPHVLGAILTVKGSKGYDFISRYFSPWNGINEDPVTGSAHSVLTPYWSRILGKTEMLARQCSKRGGDLYLRMRGSDRVEIGGEFKIVLEGTVSVA